MGWKSMDVVEMGLEKGLGMITWERTFLNFEFKLERS